MEPWVVLAFAVFEPLCQPTLSTLAATSYIHTSMSSESVSASSITKPCRVCRRRKVRCDKVLPACGNCIRNGVPCVYETSRETGASHQMLQERIDRLEQIVDDLAAKSTPSISTREPTRVGSSATSPRSYYDAVSDNAPADTGKQVFDLGRSYHLSTDAWLSLDGIPYDPALLLKPDDGKGQDDGAEDENDPRRAPELWPLMFSPPTGSTQYHLPINKEEVLLQLFVEKVDPFISMIHCGQFWQMITHFREGKTSPGWETEALLMSVQSLAVAVLPPCLIEEKLELPAAYLRAQLRTSAEVALGQANVLNTRSTVLLTALLYYIVGFTSHFIGSGDFGEFQRA